MARTSARSRLGALVGGVAAGAVLWQGVRAVNRSSRRVSGRSMQPWLQPGDLVLVVPSWRLRRGDVVVVRDPRHPRLETIKRVVGLPGEEVELRDRLFVDGAAYDEPYLRGLADTPGTGRWRVPPGHVVVLGDNRAHSTDSRTFGAVPRALVLGRVALRPRRLARHPHRRPGGQSGLRSAPRTR